MQDSNLVDTPVNPVSGGSPVTFLFSKGIALSKRFFINATGEVESEPYPDAKNFTHETVWVHDLRSLIDSILTFATKDNVMLVRGNPIVPASEVILRRKDTLAEQPEGSRWVMLDIDGIDAPEGIDPNTPEAIDWLIDTKLPACFQNVNCFYQFSSSAGILNSTGELRKTGIRVHLFFWFVKPIPGIKLAAWLKLFCLESQFFNIELNKAGYADLKYGIDMAPIRSAVQPHYIVNPSLEAGVRCKFAEEDREGIIKGATNAVNLPDIDDNIYHQAKALHDKLLVDWKLSHGFKKQTRQFVTKTGFATQTYYELNNVSDHVKTGRTLDQVEMRGKENSIAQLFFSDEGTPGSWYVVENNPQIAWRYGGGESLPLKELSEDAYRYVQNDLKWFNDLPHGAMALTEQGFLPSFDSFAAARHSIILAPTGSGKTKAAIEWMAEASKSKLLIYVAQTIALVNQMGDDLRKEGVQWSSYTDFGPSTPLKKGVYVTTNESLYKIIEVVNPNPYNLVLDEIHMGLDDFSQTQKKFELLQKAIIRASRVFYMTGTLTDIQRQMIAQIVASTLPNDGVNEQAFCTYEFAPVKKNSLKLRNLKNYRADVITLFDDYAARIERKEPIPRTVFILPTSKLQIYRQLAAQYGLSEFTQVVSNPENTKNEINEARIGSDAILIASPLFSVGLNFDTPPTLFLCRFDLVDVDTSVIVQTINRANRNEVPCEVRIYCGNIDSTPFYFPNNDDVIAEISSMLKDELPEISIDLSLPMFLDRLAYREYRNIERNSAKALGHLIQDNQFQNYVIEDERDLVTVGLKEKNESYKQAHEDAKIHYDLMVMRHPKTTGGFGMSFGKLNELATERNDFKNTEKRIDRAIEAEELRVVMTICDLKYPSFARKISIPKLRILLGDVPPWLSELRGHAAEWASFAAIKIKDLLSVVDVLAQLQKKAIDGYDIARKLNQDKAFQAGLKTLCCSQSELTALNRDFDKLKGLRELERKDRDEAKKKKAESKALNMTREILQSIGIFFPVEGKGQDKTIKYDLPIVPEWNFGEIKLQLLRLEHLLKKLPSGTKHLSRVENPEHSHAVTINTCRECSLYNHRLALCNIEVPVDFLAWGIESGDNYPNNRVEKNCAHFNKTLAKLMPPPAF